jgi:hypothetical protein
MHVLQTVTRPKKVTHLVTIGDQEHHCTSATHVCELLQGLGHNVTLAIVYRCCTKDPRRTYRKLPLPENVQIRRVSKDGTVEDTPPAPQSV